ncbi:MAG: hypothetical protein K9N10_16600 [Deltaproteobacteria bacterium]|nr:hypothetical protein [Deltaproteobacteria bacterium]
MIKPLTRGVSKEALGNCWKFEYPKHQNGKYGGHHENERAALYLTLALAVSTAGCTATG